MERALIDPSPVKWSTGMSIERSSDAARRRGLAILAVVTATFGFTAAVASPATAQATTPPLRPAAAAPAAAAPAAAPAAAVVPHAVPGPPAGFTTTWSDDFTGASGSGIDGNWKYDTGPGSTFGTGEIETMTNST